MEHNFDTGETTQELIKAVEEAHDQALTELECYVKQLKEKGE